jgi:hypothetical protein
MGSRHFSEGAYDRIAIKLFQKLNVLVYQTPSATVPKLGVSDSLPLRSTTLNTTRPPRRRFRALAPPPTTQERHPRRHHLQVPRARNVHCQN